MYIAAVSQNFRKGRERRQGEGEQGKGRRERGGERRER